MPSTSTTAEMIFASLQSAFATSTAVPGQWQLTVGEEAVADMDASTDGVCPGLGVVLIPSAALEVGTSQASGGTLYMKMTVAMMIFRCAPRVDNAGMSPTPADHLAFTRRVLDDMERMLRAVWLVAEYDWITEGDISDPVWSAIPVDGGVGGGVVQFEVASITDC